MKTSILNTFNVLFTLILFASYTYTQNPATVSFNAVQKSSSEEERVGTIIDVKGSRFSDRMWVITVPQCTRDFDNGWDGFKMFGSPVAPQLFAMENSGNFQVNSIPDMNNTYLGFKAGEDSVYTLTFTHYFVQNRYKDIYLVDLLENKTINVYANGSQYTFVAKKTSYPEKRFKLLSIDYAPVIDPTKNIGTVIEVLGTRYNDKLSIFDSPECTTDYNKAWDTYKTFGSALNPHLYATESTGNYQVKAVNDINNTYLSFLSGEDNIYTLKFSNYNLNNRYQELYLIDLVENKTIDIFENGTEYSFVAEQSSTPVKRFALVTSKPIAVAESSVQPIDVNSAKNSTKIDNSGKSLKVFSAQRSIVIDNPTANSGQLNLYSAQSGKIVANYTFRANVITTISTEIPSGVYVVKGTTKDDTFASKFILQ